VTPFSEDHFVGTCRKLPNSLYLGVQKNPRMELTLSKRFEADESAVARSPRRFEAGPTGNRAVWREPRGELDVLGLMF